MYDWVENPIDLYEVSSMDLSDDPFYSSELVVVDGVAMFVPEVRDAIQKQETTRLDEEKQA